MAWPLDAEWIPLTRNGVILQDPTGDAQKSIDIVSTPTDAPVYFYNDGVYLNFRIRLNGDPRQGSGLKSFGWGIELDINQNADDYEWLIMCSGIPSTEGVFLEKNTVQGSIGDPSDAAELFIAQYPLTGYFQVSVANTTSSGDADYFLDFKLPYAVFKGATGMTDDTAIRFIGGTSNNAQNLNAQGSDLIGSSGNVSLYDGLGDYFTPGGLLPATGSNGQVDFVKSLAGNEEATVITVGQTVYVRVSDTDQTPAFNPGQTVVVTLVTSGGDTEVLTLTATGVAGKFTGSLPSASAAGGRTSRDNILQILAGESVTVTYLDILTAAGAATPPIARTDILQVTATGTDIRVTKSASTLAPVAGQTMTFTLTASNLGQINATGVQVTDLLPAGLTFVAATGSGSYTSASGLWNIGTLNAGTTATLTLTVTVDIGVSGSLTNTATLLTVSPTDVVPANNSASVTLTVGGADLALIKSVSKSSVISGESVVFTLSLRNYGPLDAANVVIRDLLPAGLTYVSHSGAGSYLPISGDWTLASVPAGTITTLAITATVTGAAGSSYTNTATVLSSSRPDPVASNNSASATVTIGTVDLAVSITVNNSTPTVGDVVTYTVKVTNNGPSDASNIQLRAQLNDPSNPFFFPISGLPEFGTYSTSTGLWNFASLANGQTATLTITATVFSTASLKTISTVATLRGVTPVDSNAANNEAKVDIAVGGTDLRLTKTASTLTPGVGEQFNFIITLTNLGPRPATGVSVQDFLPSEVSYKSDSTAVTPVATGNVAGSFSKTSGVWSGISLNTGASATLTLTVQVNNGTAGKLVTNSAFITAATQPDPNQVNNIASVQVAITGTDLAITKTVSNSNPIVGQNFTYTLTVTNNGPRNATNVRMRDILPPELEFVSVTGTGVYTHLPNNPSDGLWESATPGTGLNINTGENATLTITARVRTGSSKLVITNTATILSADQGDVIPGNNTASVNIFVNTVDLAITKTVSDPAPAQNALFTYTVSVNNNGPNLATNIAIEDFQPAGVTFVGSSATSGTFALGRWQIPTLATGATATLQITAQTGLGTAGTTIINTASLVALDQVDTDSANDSASVNIIPTLAGNLSTSTKSVIDSNGGDISLGDTLRYTIVLNESEGTDAYNVQVTDQIPANVANFTIVSIPAGATNNSTYFGTGSNGNGTLDISGITVPASGSVTIIFDVQVSGPNGATIANSANIINAGGLGGVATAPTLTIGASTLPGAGIKQLYLQAPDSENSPTIPQTLSRTPVTAYPNPIRVRIRETDTPVRWDLAPVLQTPLSLNPNTQVVLQIADEDATLHNLRLTLSYNTGTGSVILAQQDFTNLNIANFIPVAYTFNMTTPSVVIPVGSRLELTVDNEPDNIGSRVFIFPYAAFTGTPDTSRVELDSATVINVDSIDLFDTGGVPIAGGVAPGTTVHIRATVSDPFGSYDINAARITLTDPLGAIQVNNQPMAPYADSLAATKTFEYIYDLPAGAELGNWTIRVDADEGSEGTISDYGLGTLSVTEPMPSLMILKSADKATVNPGEVITYTITTMNSGAGPATTVQVFDNLSPYVGLILDYDGVTPPYEPFDFVPGTSGLTFGTPVYYNSDGIFNPNFAAGEDDTVVRWETPMTGSFNPGSQFTLRFKVRVK